MKWFCKHDWSAWSEIVPTYSVPYQYRYCNNCNKIVQRRVASTTNEVNLAVWNHNPPPSEEE